MLAARRLTEAQLRERLAKREISGPDIDRTVAECARQGFIDDALFARLFVETHRKAVGNRRLVAELVRKGIERAAAQEAAGRAEEGEIERLDRAVEKLFRARPSLSLAAAARSLERLGFPAPAIYGRLRERARTELAFPESVAS